MLTAGKTRTTFALMAALLLILPATPTIAAKVVIEDARCKQLDGTNLSAIETQLKETKAIAADDTVECTVPPGTKATQKNFPLTTLLPALKKLFCRQKNSDVLEACAKVSDKGARESCVAGEKSRFSAARKAC